MALGYDTLSLVADAITRAGSTDRRAIRDALAHTDAFLGVTGHISFDENGDPIKAAVIMKIKDGKAYFLESFQP